jgi:MFS family permease
MGLFEAGLIPCINVYIALVYKKSERGKRSAIIFAFSAFSSAFGGLLAYGLTQVHGPNGWQGWRWLFAVEGAMTLVLVPLFWFLFPNRPTMAWFLTAEEKGIMQARYVNDLHWGHNDEFTWAESLSAFTDPKWWAFWIYQFSSDICLYGFTTFLPKIVSGLGYSGVQANLMTIPIYIAGLIFFLNIAYFSDRVGLRAPFLTVAIICLIIGYSILISVESLKVRFFACFGKITHDLDYSFACLTISSHCTRYLSDDRTVAHVAARQHGTSLQESYHGGNDALLWKYCRRCCWANIYHTIRTAVYQRAFHQPWLRGCGVGHGSGFDCRNDNCE